MKKISIISALFAVLAMFTACSSDNDSNPTFRQPDSFVLNTPALAGNTYDLANCKYIELTCTQPDYGYTAAVTYSVEISFNQDMTASVMLPTSYTTAKMNVDASEIAVAATQMKVDEGVKEEQFPIDAPLYIRLKAALGNGLGEVNSNVICLQNIHLTFALPAVTLPEKIYAIGGFCGWNWDNAPQMTMVNGAPNTFWHMVYMGGGQGVKFNVNPAWDGGEVGFAQATVTDLAGAGVKDDGGNFGAENAGWYLAVVRLTLDGRDLKYDVTFQKPEVYLMGPVSGGWDECKPEALFTVPETMEGEFVSPAFIEGVSGDPGVRAHIKIEGYDWWKTEFMVFDGKIVYRGNGGDQERVSAEAGQKLYLNFATDKGRIE